MRLQRIMPLLPAFLIPLAVAGARADSGWSATASGGLAFTRPQGEASLGGWIDLFHSVGPTASLGVEGGYVAVRAPERPYVLFTGLYQPNGETSGIVNASAVGRLRSAGPVRVHLLATVGYYGLPKRTLFMGLEQAGREGFPGFSVAVGFSGSGLVRPGFQLRWHEVIRPDNEYLDIISFEAGLHFN